VEDILPTTKQSPLARPSTRADPRPPLGAADRNQPSTNGSPFETVDLAAGGLIAVTRPAMPRIFRLLLALSGVRI
jgi:hypothetical protein